LLMAATQFKVMGSLDQGSLHIIQLEETTPPFPLLQPVPIIGSLSIHSNPPEYITDVFFFTIVDSITTSSGTSKDKTVKSSTKHPTSKHVAADDNSIIDPVRS
ncbi:unnamed protein product, partial [Rotaria magnacalcarata]